MIDGDVKRIPLPDLEREHEDMIGMAIVALYLVSLLFGSINGAAWLGGRGLTHHCRTASDREAA